MDDDDQSHRTVVSADKYKVCGRFRPCTQRALKMCSPIVQIIVLKVVPSFNIILYYILRAD